MVLFLTILLGVSIGALLALFSIKAYEIRHGALIGGAWRIRMVQRAHTGVVWFEQAVPTKAKQTLTRSVQVSRAVIALCGAQIMLWIELTLERSLEALRRMSARRVGTGAAPASEFLREVAAYKQTLKRRRALIERRRTHEEEK